MMEPSTKKPIATPPAKMLHHTAYVTRDVGATVDFYTRILGLKLVATVIDDKVPSTGDPFPYIHLFFELGDGSTIAFFESLGLPPPAESTHPAYDIFNHLALEVGSTEAVDNWLAKLKAEGIECVGPVEHGVIYSIYFRDPNGLRLEFTTTTNPHWKDHDDRASADVENWLKLKDQARKDNDTTAVIEWIKSKRGQHKNPPQQDSVID